ncbi:MAG: hypothetical protein WCG25_01805 [bacterium]
MSTIHTCHAELLNWEYTIIDHALGVCHTLYQAALAFEYRSLAFPPNGLVCVLSSE